MNHKLSERFERVLDSYKMSSQIFFWIYTAIFGFLVFVLSIVYVFIQSGKSDIFHINQAAANTGTLLIAFSLILSSLSYFFDLFDRLIIYRKHLGIIGFAYIVSHIIFVAFLMPWMYKWTDWFGIRIIPFSLGLTATMIFLLMTLISNRYAVTTMGGLRWRQVLRYGGYGALLLTLCHMWFAAGRYWRLMSFWSLGQVVFVFGILTVVLRLLMATSMMMKKTQIQPKA